MSGRPRVRLRRSGRLALCILPIGALALPLCAQGADEAMEQAAAAKGQSDQAPPVESAPASVPGTDSALSLEVIPVQPREEPPREQTPDNGGQARGMPQLEEIVVTATKREKSVREIPVSITALRGEDLEKIGARDIRDYVMKAPGMTMDDADTGEALGRRMTIRGVGGGAGLGNQTVGQFIGDAPMGDPYSNYGSPDVDPFDLKTVEILRGPQGTTFGASALNGAIRYVPNQPVLQEWSGRGFVDYTALRHTGSFDHAGGTGMSYGAAVNAPFGDSVAVRASGVVQDIAGVYDNLQRQEDNANSAEKWSARAALRWQPLDGLSLDLLYLKQQSHLDDVLVADNGDGRLENNNKPGPSFIDFGFSLAHADLRYEADDWGTLVYQFTRQWKLSGGRVDAGIKATGSQGIQTIDSKFDLDTSGSLHELRLVSPDGEDWEWIVGLFARDYVGHLNTSLNTPILQGVQRGTVDPLTAKETAIFGELTRRFGPHWEATLGLRQYETKIAGSFESRSVGVPVFDEDFSQSERGLNPKFSLAYTPTDSLMVYLTIARGFQFGGLNTPLVVPGLSNYQNPVTGTPVPLTFSSSVLWSREVGLRTDWLDRTLRLDLAFFDIRWSKAQLSQNAGGAASNAYIDNVGEVSSRGVEGSLTWLTPLPGLSLNLLASYVRAVTTKDYVNGQNTVAKGAEMPASPPVQTSATLAYSSTFGPWLAGVSASHSYWSRAYSDLQHTYEMYDFTTLDLSANVSRPDWIMRPALTIGVTNLADDRGVVGRNAAGALSGDIWTYNRPRALSLRLTAEFD